MMPAIQVAVGGSEHETVETHRGLIWSVAGAWRLPGKGPTSRGWSVIGTGGRVVAPFHTMPNGGLKP